jgi:hypothetical protein
MNESQWDEKLRAFLKKTGEDLKRAGSDIRAEAERLMHEVKDPARQEKVKQGLTNFSVWAKKTAEEVATVVEAGVKKAEVAVRDAAGQVQRHVDTAPPPPPSPQEPLRHDTPVDTPAPATEAEPARKSIGGSKKKASAKAKATKKTLGKKRTP